MEVRVEEAKTNAKGGAKGKKEKDDIQEGSLNSVEIAAVNLGKMWHILASLHAGKALLMS